MESIAGHAAVDGQGDAVDEAGLFAAEEQHRVGHVHRGRQAAQRDLAQALGADGIRVEKRKDFIPALKKAAESGRPMLIDCHIDCDDKVFPMVPAGHAIEDVFDQDDLEKEAKQ